MKGTRFKIPLDFQTFSTVGTLFGVEESKGEDADVVFLGIPYDLSTSNRSGARFAPSRIREVSRIISGVDFYIRRDVFREKSLVDYGDIRISNNTEETIHNIEDELLRIVGKSRVLISGGDHLITYPVLRALYREYGRINLLHFDAHLDSWKNVNGSKLNHGTWLRKTVEDGLVKTVYQVGLRGSMYSERDLEFQNQHGIRVISVRDFKRIGIEKMAEEINKIICEEKFYITIDIDVVDPAFAPGTGVPEPGGLSSYELMELLRGLEFNNFMGGDIVEVSPPYDVSDITSILATQLFFIMLSKIP
ncbi:MAG: agmatinase [Thermoplasmata archaeon]|nr:agmatinase [Thermoplasmatales archaeon]